jgi:hypothetical protein
VAQVAGGDVDFILLVGARWAGVLHSVEGRIDVGNWADERHRPIVRSVAFGEREASYIGQTDCSATECRERNFDGAEGRVGIGDRNGVAVGCCEDKLDILVGRLRGGDVFCGALLVWLPKSTSSTIWLMPRETS